VQYPFFFQKNPGVVGNKRVEGFKMKVEGGNNSVKMVHPGWAIRLLVPEEAYTDRAEYLDYLYKAAIKAIGRRTMSTVLLGQGGWERPRYSSGW